MKLSHRQESGFTLISAIFLIVVLAALGAYMVTIGGVQRTTITHTILAARVYFGAKSGLEWAINRAVNTSSACPSGSTCTCFTPANPSFAPVGSGLNGINVTISCAYTTHTDNYNGGGGTSTFNSYYITSTAEYANFGEPDYTRRVLSAAVTNRYGPP